MSSINYVTIMYQRLLLSLTIACTDLFQQNNLSTATAAALQTSQFGDIGQHYLVNLDLNKSSFFFYFFIFIAYLVNLLTLDVMHDLIGHKH